MKRRRQILVQRTFLDILALPPRERAREAARRLADDPAALREVLRLLPHATPPSRFLEPPTGAEGTSPQFSEPDSAPGRVLGGRYRIVREVGRGGGGVVAEAFDEIAKERVAVKLMRGLGEEDLRRVRQEVATVRWLALPGVVQFRDDGVDGVDGADGADAWCVTDFVDGRPFPGAGRRGRWERIEPVALGLLETMARIHWAGVVHRDLKPRNVLVDAAGRATVLDLGLAAPRDEGLLGGRDDVAGGTPGYAAPEQLDGRRCDARTDIYALGVMLFVALSGRLPEEHRDRGCARLPAPPRVRRAIARMIAPDPRRRPATVAEALTLLRPARRGGRRRRPWTRDELKSMFAGFDRIHHLPTDAAAEMFRRTAGDPHAVEEEIASWVRAGLARPEGERYYVDRVALERLRRIPPAAAAPGFRLSATPAERRLMRALRGGDPAAVYRAAMDAGGEARRNGWPLRAGTAFAEAVEAARAARRTDWELRSLRLRLDAALSSSVPRLAEEARFAISQSRIDSLELRNLASIARAASEVLAGRADDAETILRRALHTGHKLSRSLAWAVRAAAARELGPASLSRLVRAARRWAREDGSHHARLRFLSWKASSLYAQARFAESVAVYAEIAKAARAQPWIRAEVLVVAATTAIEGGDVRLAERLSARGRAIAAARRLTRVEANAEIAQRKALYRSGALVPADPEMPELIVGVGTHVLEGVARITEAAFAWRAGHNALASALTKRSSQSGDPSSYSISDVLLFALATAAGTPVSAADAVRVARAASARCPPAVSAQVLALLVSARPELRGRLRRLVRWPAWAHGPGAGAVRREVLSLDECRSILAV